MNSKLITFNRVIEIPIKIVKPIIKKITDSNRWIRFKRNGGDPYRDFPECNCDSCCQYREGHKSSKLVTIPGQHFDADIIDDLADVPERESRMDTPPPAPDFRKPPRKNAVPFLSREEFESQLYIDSTPDPGGVWFLCWDGSVTEDDKQVRGHIRLDVESIYQPGDIHEGPIAPRYEVARRKAYALYVNKWGSPLQNAVLKSERVGMKLLDRKTLMWECPACKVWVKHKYQEPAPFCPKGCQSPPFQNVVQKLELQPITFREACAYVEKHHRHHRPPQGHKFSIAVNDGEKIVGVVMVGRPVARNLDDGWTAEVTRCCTDGTSNANSMLYAAGWRAARAMGYRKMITYILDSEPGTSLRAAGWKFIGKRGGGSWSRPGRPRIDTHPIGQKMLFEVMA